MIWTLFTHSFLETIIKVLVKVLVKSSTKAITRHSFNLSWRIFWLMVLRISINMWRIVECKLHIASRQSSSQGRGARKQTMNRGRRSGAWVSLLNWSLIVCMIKSDIFSFFSSFHLLIPLVYPMISCVIKFSMFLLFTCFVAKQQKQRNQ